MYAPGLTEGHVAATSKAKPGSALVDLASRAGRPAVESAPATRTADAVSIWLGGSEQRPRPVVRAADSLVDTSFATRMSGARPARDPSLALLQDEEVDLDVWADVVV
jgi:hypothetical protein